MNNQIRFIEQFYTIGGTPRNPEATEDGKHPVWDNANGVFTYEGDLTLTSAIKDPSSNNAIFTFSDGSTVTLTLGALAWLNTVTSAVISVFGRSGAVTAQNGDYTAAQVTNAFNKAVDTLDSIAEGTTNKHLTAVLLAAINANTAARHTHTNKTELDKITNGGGGVIPSAAQIAAWDAFVATTDKHIRDVIAAALQSATGISWTYNSGAGTITPAMALSAFTTDNLPEGTSHLYASSALVNSNEVTITLPAAATVANRCSAAVEGADYPTGWTLTAGTSPVDLLITHNQARRIADVTVFTIDAGTSAERKLLGSAAYSGIISPDGGNNTIRIEGLATINTEIVIHLLFA